MSKRAKIIAVVVAVVALAFLFTVKPPDRNIPDALVGEWHTSDGPYADRAMEISPVSISFTTGEGTVSVGTIQKIAKVQEGERTLYTVVYEMDGTKNELSFYLETVKAKNVIRFKNQQNITWTKDENS